MLDPGTALKLLTGLDRLTLLKRLKNSARSSMFFDSLIGKRLMIDCPKIGDPLEPPPFREREAA